MSPIVQMTTLLQLNPLANSLRRWPFRMRLPGSRIQPRWMRRAASSLTVGPKISGTLATGLAVNNTPGRVSGSTVSVENDVFVAQVSDSSVPPLIVIQTFTLAVLQAVQIVTTLPPALQGSAYAQQFTATTGTAPISWVVNSRTGNNTLDRECRGARHRNTERRRDRHVHGHGNRCERALGPGDDIARRRFFTRLLNSALASRGNHWGADSVNINTSGGNPPATFTLAAGILASGPFDLARRGHFRHSGMTTYSPTIQALDSVGSVIQATFSVATAAPVSITTSSPLPAGTTGVP